ncbi:MAG: stage 0 sporulation family protein [Candidatus Omnitrophota bacterium]
MFPVVQVKQREGGKIDFYDINNMSPKMGDAVIVEADRGLDYGVVVSEQEMILEADLTSPLRKISRIATKEDLRVIEKNKEKIKDAISVSARKIQERQLPMKLVEGEYSFDRSKIILYFTAEGRVDFRELVKDLAHIFRVRIELKQIGVRDEAKFLGGFGPCGRTLCCASFLKDFQPVTIKMAKEQNLPLNPAKISGLCGRLMCCLSYEHVLYQELMKGLPKEGDTIKTKEGKGKVLSINALKRSATIELEEGRQIEISYDKNA